MRLGQTAALIAIDIGDNVPVPEEVCENLQALGLVRYNSESNWEITERGRVFLDHLQGLSLPVQTAAWRMPGSDVLITGRQPLELHMSGIDDGPAPPPPPLRRKRVIPTDPDALRLEAVQMMNSGFGMNEVKEELELTESQAQQFFFGK